MNRKYIPFGFLFAGVLAFAAGLLPLLRGQPADNAFCIFGALFIVMVAVTWRQRGGQS